MGWWCPRTGGVNLGEVFSISRCLGAPERCGCVPVLGALWFSFPCCKRTAFREGELPTAGKVPPDRLQDGHGVLAALLCFLGLPLSWALSVWGCRFTVAAVSAIGAEHVGFQLLLFGFYNLNYASV